MPYTIERYENKNKNEWDDFILNKSINGTFIQTRNFIEYHGDRFDDHSIIFRKGQEIVATVLAADKNGVFIAHPGTTFGGVSISKNINNVKAIDEIFELLDEYLQLHFKKAIIKTVPRIYQRDNGDILDYFFYNKGYSAIYELNFFLELEEYKEDLLKPLTANKRRDYKYSLKNQMVFKELTNKSEISDYYQILLKNLKKLNLSPVHSLEELFDLKFNRFPDKIRFYGVYIDNNIIAGSMIFHLTEDVFHTQYLSSDQDYLKYFPMDFLIVNLINTALKDNFRIFSFGICTEDRGKYINVNLSNFKEGFGAKHCNNITYEKEF